MTILTDERSHAASLLFSKVLQGSQRRWPQPRHAGAQTRPIGAPLGGAGYLTAAVFNTFVDLPGNCSDVLNALLETKADVAVWETHHRKQQHSQEKSTWDRDYSTHAPCHHSLPCNLVFLHCCGSVDRHPKAGVISTGWPTLSGLYPGTLWGSRHLLSRTVCTALRLVCRQQ